METIKTAIVVILLLAVLYGVYVVLNEPSEPLPQEIAWHEQQVMEPLNVDLGGQLGSTAAPTDTAVPQVEMPPIAAAPAVPASVPTSDFQPPTDPAAPTELLAAAPMASAANTAGDPPPQAAIEGAPAPDLLTVAQTPVADTPAALSPVPPNSEAAASTPTQPPAAAPTSIYSQSAPSAETPAAADESQPTASVDLPTSFPEESPPAASDRPTTFSPFQNALQSAMTKIDESQWYDALWTLSLFYNSPDLTVEQQEQLLNWLDPLAAKVIYSTEHLTEPAYQVQRGDTLQNIAERYRVPWQLLANINQISNPNLLTAGTSLKVVRGPFRAEVDVTRSELTLFAGKLYAGRFPVSMNPQTQLPEGDFSIQDKQPGKVYYAGDGRTVPIEDPANPYGRVWLDLGNEVSIHGSPQQGAADGQGSISLSPLDASDVYSILSQGSSVTIRR